MTVPLLELDQVEKRYGPVTALKALSLTFGEGKAPIVAVAGESGSGKTTLASLLLGFTEPTLGEVRYRGQALRKMRGTVRRGSSISAFRCCSRRRWTWGRTVVCCGSRPLALPT